MKVLLLLFTLAAVGCMMPGGEGRQGRQFVDEEYGRDIGGAVQKAIEGEWVAGGVAAAAATLAAAARYFFTRGARAEKKKAREVEERVRTVVNGKGAATPSGA